MKGNNVPLMYPMHINIVKNNSLDTEINDLLTNRQLDCLHCLVRGMTMKQIGKTLNLSPKTVEHYLYNIRTKLHCFSRSELIGKALQMNAIKDRLCI